VPTELAEHLVFLALSEPMKPPALAVGRSHVSFARLHIIHLHVPNTSLVCPAPPEKEGAMAKLPISDAAHVAGVFQRCWHRQLEAHGVPGVTAGKFTLGHYAPRSNGDQPRVLRIYADMANGK
jgi:hypothetical protein